MKDDVCIIILNWNGIFWLKKNLPTLIKFNENIKTIVVDNNSSDESVSYLKRHFKSVDVIQHKKNYGFSKAYNLAIQKLNFEYCLLINNDVEVTKDFIKPLFNFLQRNKDFAAVQPKILDGKNKKYFEYSGAAGGFLDYFGIPFCRGRIGNSIEKDKGQYERETSIFWASGACFLVKRNYFIKLGGFDEDFWMHQEEIDFFWRLQALGKKIGYCPKSKIYHYGGGSLEAGSWRKNFYNHRNNLLMLFKNLPLSELIIVFLNRPIIDLLISFNYLFNLKIKSFFSIFLAYLSFITLIPRFLKKRKPINKKIEGKYNIHIIFLFVIKKKNRFFNLFN